MTNAAITYQLTINQKGICFGGTDLEFELDKDYGWMTRLYKHLCLEYPKFHKMDHLCKLAFLGVELLKKEKDFSTIPNDRIAMVFENSHASLDTDLRHQENINAKKTSPAIFVYTLPNILMGEIAIRNRWYGENLFVLNDEFRLERWCATAQTLINAGKADTVVGGWAEVIEDHFDLRLYLMQ